MAASSSTLERLAAANPLAEPDVRALVPEEWSDGLLARIVAEPRSPGALPLSSRRVRLIALAALVLAVLALPTYAIGRVLVDGWLSGDPAPPSVVDNFDSYTPQLGFQPEPGEAVLVARDGAFSLYATTNDRGSYCVATDTPDGGVCIRPEVARAPLLAGLMGANPSREDARRTILVVGRVADQAARTISFTDPEGRDVVREIGASGFFLAALPTGEQLPDQPFYPCKNGDWKPTFRARAPGGEEVASASIVLAQVPSGAPGVCGYATGPHG